VSWRQASSLDRRFALLHGGLLFRVVGDALGRGALWQGGSVVTVVSLLVFAASAAWCVVRA